MAGKLWRVRKVWLASSGRPRSWARQGMPPPLAPERQARPLTIGEPGPPAARAVPSGAASSRAEASKGPGRPRRGVGIVVASLTCLATARRAWTLEVTGAGTREVPVYSAAPSSPSARPHLALRRARRRLSRLRQRYPTDFRTQAAVLLARVSAVAKALDV